MLPLETHSRCKTETSHGEDYYERPKQKQKAKKCKVTVELDLGVRSSRYCVMNQEGEVVQAGSVATTKKI